MRKVLVILAMALLLGGAFAMSAQATTAFDFFINPPQTGASITYAGGATPLVGSNIIVNGVFVTGAPANNGTWAVTNGDLDFTTGNFNGSDPLHWDFGPGGTINLTGNIGATPISLSGQFTSAIVAQTIPATNNKVFIGEYVDTKSADLLQFFGLDPSVNPWAGAINLSFNAAALGPGADGSLVPFTSTAVGSGDLTNVPVPPTALLLGSGLLGLLGFRLRRKA